MNRILIVDDEKSIRITLRAFLTNEGYKVEIAEDVHRAQELLKEGSFDVVISDIVMPRVSGVTLLKQLKETAPDVKVIMMTGEPTMETAVDAVRAGACDYLTKPVGKPAILNAVSNAMKVKKLESENLQYRENLEQLVEQRTHELKDALAKVKEAQEKLIQQARMSALGEMASGIAHDFNNVLMPIVGFSDILIEDPEALNDREDAIHMLKIIRSCGEDARHIVRRLRQSYKADDSDYNLINLAEVLESVASITMPKWKEEMSANGVNIEIATDFPDTVPLILGNPTELREAFTNLIFNAVDAMPDGGVITLRLRMHDAKSLLLEVIDTGVGMDYNTSRHCIEPFFSTKGEQGTGLGLSMVCGILHRHNGRIEVDSKVGKGTVIRMKFPVPAEGQNEKSDGNATTDAGSALNVLVIDDEERSRHLLKRILTKDGHMVEVAENGQEGIEKTQAKNFDLIITDRAMPLMSGDEVAAKITKVQPDTPIIMLTGFGNIMEDENVRPMGVTRIMAKPVIRQDLRVAISEIMRETEISHMEKNKEV